MAQPSLNLEDAYEACRKETAQWAKTFYLGTMLLPPAKRRAIWAIYVWCRRTDELMDSTEAQKKSRNELSDRLNKWEDKTKNIFVSRDEIIEDINTNSFISLSNNDLLKTMQKD